MSNRLWHTAHDPDYVELIAGIRHRLANVAAPLAVLVELLDDDISNDMTAASKRSVAKVERLLTLLSALSGRGFTPPKATSIPVERRTEGMPEGWEPIINALLCEAAPDAQTHGATSASIYFDGEALYWHDNGSGFSPGILESLGRRQRAGEHGCGLGLAAICATATACAVRVAATNSDGAMLRFTV